MLANYECDLHGHTNRSDGNDSPVEYIRHAVHRGVKILAITDHDIVPPEMIELGGGKRQEITAYAKGIGVELLRGIEISCETYIDDVHLVCFGCDWNAPYFKELDEFTINSKVNSYRKLIDLLNEQGMEMTWEEVLQNNGYPVQEQFVQKKMIFELMARKGYMESWKEAKLYVKNSKEVSVKREKPDAVSVIKEIHKLGGIIILAHPYLISEPVSYKGKEMSRQEFIEILIEAGLDGIEASYTYDKTSYSGTMTKDEIKKIEEAYAKTETPVVSNNSAHRWTPDVPMMVPEINPEHMAVIEAQKKRLGTKRWKERCKESPGNWRVWNYQRGFHEI